jgi:hypothetical protein
MAGYGHYLREDLPGGVNPVVAGLVNFAEEYHYSSAKFYEHGNDHFDFITHFSGN